MPFSENGTAVLVDQNAFHRKLLRSVLRSVGFYEISEHEEVRTGLKQVMQTHPDFVFMDYDTATGSDISNYQKNIQGVYHDRQTYLFILMSHPTFSRVDKAIDSGADWIISRPFSQQALTRRLHAILHPSPLIRPVSQAVMQTFSPRPPLDLFKPGISPDSSEKESADMFGKIHGHFSALPQMEEGQEISEATEATDEQEIHQAHHLTSAAASGPSFAQPRRQRQAHRQ
nr:response regulator [uncultured Cohaesibacter sp.]